MQIALFIIVLIFILLIIAVVIYACMAPQKKKTDDWGFILCRHVNQKNINEYWKESVRCIRRFHPDKKIVIIDDNSNPDMLDQEEEDQIFSNDGNILLIQSEYPAVGELLGYYYFYKHRWFHKAIIMHDSVFVNSSLDDKMARHKDVAFLWSFNSRICDDNGRIDRYLAMLPSSSALQERKSSDKWLGCFGIMSMISLPFLDRLVARHDLFTILLPHIHSRDDRMAIERVFGIITHTQLSKDQYVDAFFDNIHAYCQWGLTYQDYKEGKMNDLPMIKIWTGR